MTIAIAIVIFFGSLAVFGLGVLAGNNLRTTRDENVAYGLGLLSLFAGVSGLLGAGLLFLTTP